METGAREAGSRQQGYQRHDNVTLLYSHHSHMDKHRDDRSLGKRALQGIGGGYQSFHRSGVSQMITNIACFFVIAFCAASQFFMGAYAQVSAEMAKEYRYLLSLSVTQLTMIDTRRELL